MEITDFSDSTDPDEARQLDPTRPDQGREDPEQLRVRAPRWGGAGDAGDILLGSKLAVLPGNKEPGGEGGGPGSCTPCFNL